VIRQDLIRWAPVVRAFAINAMCSSRQRDEKEFYNFKPGRPYSQARGPESHPISIILDRVDLRHKRNRVLQCQR
jgi:hypothetical protein